MTRCSICGNGGDITYITHMPKPGYEDALQFSIKEPICWLCWRWLLSVGEFNEKQY